MRTDAIPASPAPDWTKHLLFPTLMLASSNGLSITVVVFREFGLTPVNIVLVVLLAAMLVRAAKGRRYPLPRVFILATFVFWMAGALSLADVLTETGFLNVNLTPLTYWVSQYLIAVWIPLAMMAWFCLFYDCDVLWKNYRLFYKILIAVVFIGLLFYIDSFLRWMNSFSGIPYFVPEPVWKFLGGDWRRSHGLFTEPSHFASWVAFIWPILFFFDRARLGREMGKILKILAVITIICAVASLARTFLVIFGIQLLFLAGLQLYFKHGHSQRRIAIVAVIVCTMAVGGGAFASRLSSVVDVQDNDSTAVRLGAQSFVAEMIRQRPFFGVGVGELTAFAPYFSPNYYTNTNEIYSDMSQPKRGAHLSFGNIYLRIWGECGIIGFIAAAILYSFPQIALAKRALGNRQKVCSPDEIGCLTAAIGSFLSLCEADLPGYSGAGFVAAYALCLLYKRANKAIVDGAPARRPLIT